MQTTDQELTPIVEKHRIFGMFTAKGVIEAAKEISKIELEKFHRWFSGTYLGEVANFEDVLTRYIQHTSSSNNTNATTID